MNNLKQKLRNFLLFFLCLFYFLFRGKSRKAPSSIKNILIFRLKPHIGDMIYVTPIFAAIKKRYPDTRITLIAHKKAEGVIAGNKDVDEFIVFENNLIRTFLKIRKIPPDFAVLANEGSVEGFALLYFSGAKQISIFSSGRSLMYRILQKLAISKPLSKGTYIPPQYMSLLDPIGANDGNCHFKLYFKQESERKILETFQKNSWSENDFLVGIAPGGSTRDRWWPADRFADLANFLSRNYGARIVLIGAGIDRDQIQAVISKLDTDTHFVNFLDQPLDEYKAVISKLNLILGNDSGPMVTADAFDVPQIVFVGPTDAREYHRPAGRFNRILEAPDKKIGSISLALAKKELEDLLGNI